MLKSLFVGLAFVGLSASQALAQRWGSWPGHGGPTAVPEIDGPAGMAACAVLAGVVMLAYNRFKKKA